MSKHGQWYGYYCICYDYNSNKNMYYVFPHLLKHHRRKKTELSEFIKVLF